MTAALEGSEWSTAIPGRTLPPWKTRYPLYRRLGGSQGRSGRAENLVPAGIWSQTVQPIVSRYTDWATRPINEVHNSKKYTHFQFTRACLTILLVKLRYMLKKADCRQRLQIAGRWGAMPHMFLPSLHINFWTRCLQWFCGSLLQYHVDYKSVIKHVKFSLFVTFRHIWGAEVELHWFTSISLRVKESV